MIEIQYISGYFLIDEKSFQKLNEKGYGQKIEKSKYSLDTYEALYLVENNKAKFLDKTLTFEKISKIKNFKLINYLVYSDLRTKGYTVKSGLKFGISFRLYDKGTKIGEDHSLWLIDVVSEKDNIKIIDIVAKNRVAHTANKKLIIAIADNDNQITYLENNWKRP